MRKVGNYALPWENKIGVLHDNYWGLVYVWVPAMKSNTKIQNSRIFCCRHKTGWKWGDTRRLFGGPDWREMGNSLWRFLRQWGSWCRLLYARTWVRVNTKFCRWSYLAEGLEWIIWLIQLHKICNLKADQQPNLWLIYPLPTILTAVIFLLLSF